MTMHGRHDAVLLFPARPAWYSPCFQVLSAGLSPLASTHPWCGLFCCSNRTIPPFFCILLLCALSFRSRYKGRPPCPSSPLWSSSLVNLLFRFCSSSCLQFPPPLVHRIDGFAFPLGPGYLRLLHGLVAAVDILLGPHELLRRHLHSFELGLQDSLAD